MKAADHSRELEQVMAYLDGALDGRAAESVRVHLGMCAECRQAEQDLRSVSERLQSWDVGAAPANLQAPAASAARSHAFPPAWVFSARGLVAAAAAAVLVVAVSVSLVQPKRSEMTARLGGAESSEVRSEAQRSDSKIGEASRTSAPATVVDQLSSNKPMVGGPAPGMRQPAAEAPGPLITRTARLTLVASDFDSVRADLERIVKDAGGFIGQLVVQGARGSSRTLAATLRIPTPKMDETLAALRRLGQVTSDAQDGEDVTQQSADLDTRLSNARVSEKRLRDILERRTGKLSDVLDVEREIARVRGEIEQMESERKSLDRRVTYATISVSLSEDRKSEVNLGPVPVSRRLRNAFVEGWAGAIGSAVGAALFAVRVAPTLLLLGLVLALPAWMLRRRFFRAG